MTLRRPHTTWLALPLALLGNLVWFGLLAAAQHRTSSPVPAFTVPEPYLIYDAANPSYPNLEPETEAISIRPTFTRPSALPKQKSQVKQSWPLPSLRLDSPVTVVSLPTFTPGSFKMSTPAVAQSRMQIKGSVVDHLPSLFSGDPPSYPGWAKRGGLVGQVQLRFVVSALGQVQDIEVLHTEGDARFGPHAVRKVNTWRFDPARKDGRAVAYRCSQTIHFQPRSRP